MRNIRITIEYDGTNYFGWQVQNNSRRNAQGARRKTIQETLEKALQKIIRERVKLIASGRTDSGVHAEGQVANFKTASILPLDNMKKALNANLPKDIAINRIEEVAVDFHSRYHAKSKTYRYTILNRSTRSVFYRRYFHLVRHVLDTGLMKQEAKYLVGRHNFKSFRASDKKERNPFRTIKSLKIKKDKDYIFIEIEADGFLYNMVRNIVGTLIEVGRHKLNKGSIKNILKSKDRSCAGPTAPAKGLCLVKVSY